jgi:hypothetical protein
MNRQPVKKYLLVPLKAVRLQNQGTVSPPIFRPRPRLAPPTKRDFCGLLIGKERQVKKTCFARCSASCSKSMLLGQITKILFTVEYTIYR